MACNRPAQLRQLSIECDGCCFGWWRAADAQPLGGALGKRCMRSTDNPLEREITQGLKSLRELLAGKSTESVAGWCFSFLLWTTHNEDKGRRLTSPAKQIPLLLGVLLSTAEPAQPADFSSDDWDQAKALLESLFSAYMHLYAPADGDLGRLAPEWHRTREVSMLAFLHYFSSGLLASGEQIVDRINTCLVPFDRELKVFFGITATEQIAVCRWIVQRLQQGLDELQDAFETEHALCIKLFDEAQTKNWSEADLQEAVEASSYHTEAERLIAGMNAIGEVPIAELRKAFPDSCEAFLKAFTMRRGEGPQIRYPTERSVFEERPLIQVSDTRALAPRLVRFSLRHS